MNAAAQARHRFLVGIDAMANDPGPVTLARFFVEHGYEPRSCAGLYVLEHTDALSGVGHGALEHVRGLARQRVDALLAEHPQVFDCIDVHEGGDAEPRLLEAVAESPSIEALIVGRRAGAKETAMVRLGSTVRRLLRALPVPVFVVPPDLVADDIGGGPIVLAIDPKDTDSRLLHFGQALARRLGRELCLAHVVGDQWQTISAHFDPTVLVELSREHVGFARSAMDAWVLRNGLVDADVAIEEGPVIETLLDLANQRDACLILCGSRRLSAIERWFASSHASELAARSRRPVGVVVDRVESEATT